MTSWLGMNKLKEQQHLDAIMKELSGAKERLSKEMAKTKTEEKNISDNFSTIFL